MYDNEACLSAASEIRWVRHEISRGRAEGAPKNCGVAYYWLTGRKSTSCKYPLRREIWHTAPKSVLLRP
jgi:hypothetical protein